MSEAESFSFFTTLATLGSHDIFVIGPRRLRDYFLKLRGETDQAFEVRVFGDKCFSGVVGYNRLLKSRAFYETFANYKYILIVQTDALVLADQLSAWCDRGYSYIGAPLFLGYETPMEPLTFTEGGNGGFSLRKVRDFIRVLSYPRYIPDTLSSLTRGPPGIRRLLRWIKHRWLQAYSFQPLQPQLNEDLFWSTLVPKRCKFFTVPAPQEAVPFAFEVAPDFLYKLNGHRLPFGCHAWEKYNPQFWRKVLGGRGMRLPQRPT